MPLQTQVTEKISPSLLRPIGLSFPLVTACTVFFLQGPSSTYAMMVLSLIYGAIAYAAAKNFNSARDPRDKVFSALKQQLRRAKRGCGQTCLILFQVDELTSAEDHYNADQRQTIDDTILLQTRAIFGADKVIAQLQPGRFAVVLPACQNMAVSGVALQLRELQAAVEKPIGLGSGEARQTISAGYGLSGRMMPTCERGVFKYVSEALFDALRTKSGTLCSYAELLHKRRRVKGDLLADFDEALIKGHIQPYFQPQISAKTGDITGFEALVRWQHPTRGLIPPVEFLPLLEKSGDISRITHMMIERSLSTVVHWRKLGLDAPRIGINFAEQDLSDPTLADMIAMELDRFGLQGDCLSIEVLETVVSTRSDAIVSENLKKLADLGCCIDLDDFGTGNASICNIQRLSVARIKIDRSFITNMVQNHDQRVMVSAILSMAEKLGISTVAEGVESDDERRMLAEMGCLHLQGFGIGRPMPAIAVEDWIHTYNNRLTRKDPLKLTANI